MGGIFIITFKPFRTGDLIEIDDATIGTVMDITLRHTVIRNYKNGMIVIPNSIVNKEKIVNFDIGEKKSCEFIDIGISYDSDVDFAKKIMQEECGNHPLIFDNRSAEEKHNNVPVVKTALIGLDDSSVQLRAWAWANSYVDAASLKRDVLESIKKRFDKEGIDIPYPHRTVIIKDTFYKRDKEEQNMKDT
ncbi:mechanosensitive ion channel family protein [Cerina litoralis]|uniref:mechanosensitive ion channel family protein n=1 Tax=Cerina litoralis TaxID=2874477 RepID=UPI00295B64E7|nr:mechanosensitive ion channel family protein [Cerina litoralis]